MQYEFTLKVDVNGVCSENELRDFIEYELRGGSISMDNPFVSEEGTAEISDVEIY